MGGARKDCELFEKAPTTLVALVKEGGVREKGWKVEWK
jgi:hypothetical protein